MGKIKEEEKNQNEWPQAPQALFALSKKKLQITFSLRQMASSWSCACLLPVLPLSVFWSCPVAAQAVQDVRPCLVKSCPLQSVQSANTLRCVMHRSVFSAYHAYAGTANNCGVLQDAMAHIRWMRGRLLPRDPKCFPAPCTGAGKVKHNSICRTAFPSQYLLEWGLYECRQLSYQ